MSLLIIIFAVVFVALYGVLNYYIGLRGWQGVGSFIPFLNNRAYWIIFWAIALSYVAAMLLSRYFPEIVESAFSIIGGYWMAVMLYLLLILPLIDIIRLFNKRFMFLPQAITGYKNFALIIGLFILAFLTALMAYGTWSGRSAKVNRYSVNIDKNGGSIKELKVVMVSDIHLGDIVDNARLTKMVDEINELKPDIVLIPGDIIDNKLEPYIRHKMGENFKRLKTRYGVFATLGNHEVIANRTEDITKEYNNSGIKVLRDEVALIENSIYIVGRDDSTISRSTGKARKDLHELLTGVDKSKPVILLDHQPRELDKAEEEGIDMQLSGHTHKGQFAPIDLITKRIFEIDYGYLKKGNLNVIVSSGYGTWGPPIRIGSRSEIVETEVHFK